MTKDNSFTKPYYGWLKDKPDHRDFKFSSAGAPVSLPSKVDLRSKMPPVVQQGYIGSCTACSSLAMVEFLLRKDYGKRAFSTSILAQYFWTRKLEGNERWDTGAEIRTALKSLNKFGAAHAKFWPYRPQKFAIAPNKPTRQDAKKHRVVEYRRLNQNLSELKKCIAMGYPFIFGFWVYESFEGIELDQTGMMPKPDTAKERFLGGHAVCCIGYDDNEQAFLIRNSWGTNWALKGHYWMPYELVVDPSLSEDFWTARMVTMPPVRKPKPRRRKPRRRRRNRRWRPRVRRSRNNGRLRV